MVLNKGRLTDSGETGVRILEIVRLNLRTLMDASEHNTGNSKGRDRNIRSKAGCSRKAT